MARRPKAPGKPNLVGRLVRLFEVTLPTDYAYYVVTPMLTAMRPKIVAFRDWLVDQASLGRDDPTG